MSANVDQKRVLKFNSLADFNAVSTTLEYPGLFMIGDTTTNNSDGESINRSAARASYFGLGDAVFGDIVMYDINSNKLFGIPSENYNLTDYPFGNYKPIAVCIFDKTENKFNQTIFLSVQWADDTTLGIPSASKKAMSWGLNNVDLFSINPILNAKLPNGNDTDASSIEINDIIKTLVTGTSINDTGNGHSSAFFACWKFKTYGTEEGDWYLPSVYDCSKYMSDFDNISGVFTQIKKLCGNTYLTDENYTIWSCVGGTSKNSKSVSRGASASARTSSIPVRPVFVIQS
jgi:hypothetical protein